MSGRDLDPEAMCEQATALAGVETGELLALEDGIVPLVLARGQVRRGRAALDLQGAHVGREVVLAYEQGDPARPIVLAVLRGTGADLSPSVQDIVEMDLDGQRLLVQARKELVLRCGKASITLTRAGKILIDGSYVLSRSRGPNRIQGGSVQIN
jgi:hypothetical protein